MAGRSATSMAKVCAKRPFFAFQEFLSYCTDRRRWRNISHTTHFHTGEGAKEEDTPQNPTKFRRFFRFDGTDGFSYLHRVHCTGVRLRHISARLLTRFRFVASSFYFVRPSAIAER